MSYEYREVKCPKCDMEVFIFDHVLEGKYLEKDKLMELICL